MNTSVREHLTRLLVQSQKYTGTDMVYLAKSSFWLGLGRVLSTATSFFSSLAFANILLPETYGIYRYALTIFGFLTLFTLTGLDTAITTSTAHHEDQAIKPALKQKILYGFLGLLVGIGISVYYLIVGNQLLAGVVFITALSIPFMDPFYLFTSVLNGKKQFALSTKYNVILRVSTTIIIIATVFITQKIWWIVGIFFFSTIVVRYLLWVMTTKYIEKTSESNEITTRTLRFGKHLSLINLISQGAVLVDKALIFHYSGGAALASYYLAQTPFKQVQSIFTSFNVLAIPKLSQAEIGTLKKTLPGKVAKLYIIIIPIIIAYGLLAPWFFKVLYPSYLDTVQLSTLFILLLLFFPISIFSNALTSHHQTKKIYTTTVSYAIIRTVLLLITVPLWGTFGAWATIMLSNSINTIAIIRQFYRMQ